MNLILNPKLIKIEVKKEELNTILEPISYNEKTSFFNIKISYEDLTVIGEGYDKIKIIRDLTKEINELHFIKKFLEEIPSENIIEETQYFTKEVKNIDTKKK